MPYTREYHARKNPQLQTQGEKKTHVKESPTSQEQKRVENPGASRHQWPPRSRLPKGDNESALFFTHSHVIDNPGNKEDWGDQPIVFPSPADGKSINSFGPRTPPSRTKPGQRKTGKNYDSQNDLRCGVPTEYPTGENGQG